MLNRRPVRWYLAAMISLTTAPARSSLMDQVYHDLVNVTTNIFGNGHVNNSPSVVPEGSFLTAPTTVPTVLAPAAIVKLAKTANPASSSLPTTWASAAPGITTPPPSSLTPSPSLDLPGCTLWATCNLFYQVGNLLPPSRNSLKYHRLSMCIIGLRGLLILAVYNRTHLLHLPLRTSPTCMTQGSLISRQRSYLSCLRQSPSVYAVFPLIEARDGCMKVGHQFQNVVTSFAPGDLSTTRADGKTYSFNFADLPCPPPEVGWDPTVGPYAPALAPLPFLWGLDHKFANCIPGASQGIDPFTTLMTATAASGPGLPGCGRHCGRTSGEDYASGAKTRI